MPLYLTPRGNSVAIATCDRCHMKKPYDSLVSDGNSPKLRVCPSCSDVKDPWRLAPPPSENIGLPNARPDVKLEV